MQADEGSARSAACFDWQTKSSPAPLVGVRCSAVFDFLYCRLHAFDERLKLAVLIRRGSPLPPVNGAVLEWVSNLPGVEMHVHMRNSVAVYLVVDFDRAGHLPERQRGNLDVAHEGGGILVRKLVDFNHMELQHEAAMSFEARIPVRYESRHAETGNGAFRRRPRFRSLIADEAALFREIPCPLG